jgi:hypothetical protein
LMLIFFCKIPSCFSNSYPNRFIPNTKNHLCKVWSQQSSWGLQLR